jgi:Lon protease-like protein
MPRPGRIPLFPLDTVLLPGMKMPLHIFEPRYKIMIGLCLRGQLEFGIILAASKAIATLGCTAEILEKVKDYPDGRMDIVTEGRAVFRLIELIDEKEYYEGDVEYAEDEISSADPQPESRLIDTFDQCFALLYGRPRVHEEGAQSPISAYRMAGLLPMELEKRQALLEMRQESKRRDLVLRWMNEFLPKLMELQRVRKRAGGNGHGPN